jgi:hypothetical protein
MTFLIFKGPVNKKESLTAGKRRSPNDSDNK